MSLKFMQGFETCVNVPDLLAQGWVCTGTTGQYMFGTQSDTGVAGRAFQRFGAHYIVTVGSNDYWTCDDNYAITSSPSDWFYNTNVTVNQAWTAGGFVLGGAATSYGRSDMASLANEFAKNFIFDGTTYWQARGSALYTSTDLQTWTQTPVTPTAISNGALYLSNMGNGVVMACTAGAVTSVSAVVYSTTNKGTSWTSTTLPNAPYSGSYVVVGCATGNSAYPHCLARYYQGNTTFQILVGTLGQSFTVAVGSTASSGSSPTNICQVKVVNGYIIAIGGGCLMYALANDPNLNTAAAWTVVSGFNNDTTDFAFFPGSNSWLFTQCAPYGVLSIPNPGTVSNPMPPTSSTGTTVLTLNSSTIPYNVVVVGNNAIVTGVNGVYYYSTDGQTWNTKFTIFQNGATAYPNFPGYSGTVPNWGCYYNAIWDGTRYLKVNSSNTSVSTGSRFIASSTDGVNNWKIERCEQPIATGSNGGYQGFGLRALPSAAQSGALPASAGSWVHINSGSATASSVPLSVYINSTTGTAVSVPNNTTYNHFYEIVGTAVPGTVNAFTIQLYVDNTLVYTSAAGAFSVASTDTTSLLHISLPRSLYLYRFDDLYFTLLDGQGLQGPLGPVNIQVVRPSADVQAQWTKDGSEASNALAVRASAVSQATGYVSTTVDGAIDEYSTADTVLSNYSVLATQVEGYFQKTSVNPPVVKVGIKTTGGEIDSPQTTVTSSTWSQVTLIAEQDPQGKSWTPASVEQAHITLTKVS